MLHALPRPEGSDSVERCVVVGAPKVKRRTQTHLVHRDETGEYYSQLRVTSLCRSVILV